MKRLFVPAVCLALIVFTVLPASAASSGPPPLLSCFPGVGPCQETDHFGQLTFIGTPLPGCSTISGFVQITTIGNGVQHVNVNGAQDFWFTSTMVGPTTIVQGSVDLMGVFTPETSLPSFTGHMQQWFGVQGNRSNFSVSGTTNFQGTNSSTGASVSLHFNFHMNTTGSSSYIPNPNSAHFDVSCS